MSAASVSQIAAFDPLQMSVNTVEYKAFDNYECTYCHTSYTSPLFHPYCPVGQCNTRPSDFKSSPVAKVFLFGRDPARERHEIIVSDFIPRFYTLPTDPALTLRMAELTQNGVTSIAPSPYKDLDENPVLQVNCQIPKQVTGTKQQLGIRSMFAATDEADVKFRTRFLISMKVLEGVQVRSPNQVVSYHDLLPILVPSALRILYFDIEVDSSEDVPSWEHPDRPVTIVSFYDNYTGVLTSFAWHPHYKPQKLETTYWSKIKKGKSLPWHIFVCINERDMLQQIVNYIAAANPDLLTGWNIQTFDLPYLKKRSESQDVTFNMISPMQFTSILQEEDKKKIGFKIWGRIVFDLLTGYKGMQTHEIQSFKLDKVVDFEFHCGKVHSEISMSELWHINFKKCLVLNAIHTEACIEIDKKRNVIGFCDGERRFTGCEFEDVLMRSRVIDVTLLREAQDDLTVLPTKPLGGGKREPKSKGAMVILPKKGKHHIVCGVDMSAFYPSIFIALNASKEMRVKDEQLIKKLEELHQFYHLLPFLLNGKYPKLPFVRSNNKTWFKNTKDSLIRRTIRKFLDRRKDIKKLRDKHLSTKKCVVCSTMEECNDQWNVFNETQKMYKTRINAMYGVFGYPNFRLHDKPTFASVPDQAVDILMFAKALIESPKMFKLLQQKFPTYSITEQPEIIYGDTDSLYIELSKELSVIQAVEIGEFIISYINKKIRVYILRMHTLPKDFLLKIDLEKVFSPFMLGTQKKRWAGRCRWEDGKFIDKIIKMGFEAVRSDTPLVSKGAQDRYIDLFCLDIEDKPILKGIRTILKRIRTGYYSIEDIGIPIGVWVDPNDYELGQKHLPIHVRAVLTTKKYWGINYGVGSKILYCYFKAGSFTYKGQPITIVKGKNDVFAFQYAEDIPPEFTAQIDINVMIDKTMKSEFERIFEIADLDWDAFFYNQKPIDQWMQATP